MTEAELRQKVISIFMGWYGYTEANGGHKKIIDIYNAHKPLARGYKVKYTDAWCATTVSAAFIRAGLTDIAPTECSCAKMIELYKKLGRWQESDGYRPQPGDILMYDWDDTGSGDNTGHPEHVGMVVSVTGNAVKVIEGNKSNAVGYRTMQVGGRYIRGYCLPDYARKAKEVVKEPASVTPSKSPANAPATATEKTATISLPQVRKGSKGASVTALQQLLTAKGYDTKGVDGDFGNNTDAALRKYQRAMGLTADGICGKNSWTALLTK